MYIPNLAINVCEKWMFSLNRIIQSVFSLKIYVDLSRELNGGSDVGLFKGFNLLKILVSPN